MDEFKISGDYIELIRLLKAAGICQTGGEAKIRVDQGEVMVDGEPETRKKAKIRPGQIVSVGRTQLRIV